MVELLTRHISQNKSAEPIVTLDQEIKKIKIKGKASGVISNDEVIDLLDKSLSILSQCNFDIETELSQTYRRNSRDLNCERHKEIFYRMNIIPEFCFGCYKVQVEPGTVFELIKLFLVLVFH